MRSMRSIPAAVVVLVLLGAWAAAVAAEDTADPMAPPYFTYTAEPVGESYMPGGRWCVTTGTCGWRRQPTHGPRVLSPSASTRAWSRLTKEAV